mmetsp:Transcript_43490/g.114628  ORF Transcript_43490/g.114628 Transcript_43490/m.114628 type:complete len:232 (-) Transcript_43490:312-1007(-)
MLQPACGHQIGSINQLCATVNYTVLHTGRLPIQPMVDSDAAANTGCKSFYKIPLCDYPREAQVIQYENAALVRQEQFLRCIFHGALRRASKDMVPLLHYVPHKQRRFCLILLEQRVVPPHFIVAQAIDQVEGGDNSVESPTILLDHNVVAGAITCDSVCDHLLSHLRQRCRRLYQQALQLLRWGACRSACQPIGQVLLQRCAFNIGTHDINNSCQTKQAPILVDHCHGSAI